MTRKEMARIAAKFQAGFNAPPPFGHLRCWYRQGEGQAPRLCFGRLFALWAT